MPITTVDSLRALYGPARDRSVKKELPHLDRHCLHFIGLSPLVVVASGVSGGLDASPRGGDPGFVKAPDAHTLLVPDAPGNNRLDTLENIAHGGEAGSPVGLLFLLPGMDETLRVNGRAVLSTDEADLALCVDARRTPKLVIRVAVQSAYLHCAKALMRAELWNPARHVDRATLPSMGQMLSEQIRQQTGEEVVAETQDQMLARYRQTL